MKKLLSFILLFPVLLQAQDFWTETEPFPANVNYYATTISIVDENIVWVSGTDIDVAGGGSGVEKWALSLDGGITWSNGNFPIDPHLHYCNISAVSATTAYVARYPVTVYGLGGVWQTTDSGLTWTRMSSAAFDIGYESFTNFVHFFDANNGVVVGDPNSGYFEIYITSNAGANWNRVPAENIPQNFDGEYGAVGQFAFFGDSIWFRTNMNRLYRSDDRGLVWNASQMPTDTPDLSIQRVNFAFKNHDEGILVLQNGNQYQTVDKGVTWTDVSGLTTGPIWTDGIVNVPQTTNTYFSYGNPSPRGSSYSTNGGMDWINLEDDPNYVMKPLKATRFHSPTVGYCTAYKPGGVYPDFFRLTDPLTRLLKNESFGDHTIFSVSPNPTNGLVEITGEEVSAITIYDISGKEVFSDVYQSLDSIEIDVSHFQNGIYLAKVNSQKGFSSTVKIVKL